MKPFSPSLRMLTWTIALSLVFAMLAGCGGGGPGDPVGSGSGGTVVGRVVDAVSSLPITGARVSIPGAFAAFSGADGTFTVNDVPTGMKTANVAATNYDSRNISVNVTSGTVDMDDVSLVPNGEGPPPPPP